MKATFLPSFWRNAHWPISLSPSEKCIETCLNWISHSFQKLLRLHLNGFTYLFTLSSKFFSTFPHGTCLLSVPHQYLALDEVYHPLWAAFPNNSTLMFHFGSQCSSIWASHLLWVKTHSNVLRLALLAQCKTYMSHFTLLQKQRGLTLSFSLFIRHYWGNHCYFLFLRLIICLNSASALV